MFVYISIHLNTQTLIRSYDRLGVIRVLIYAHYTEVDNISLFSMPSLWENNYEVCPIFGKE